MLYYAARISENIRRREPEGYLICVNVPIARSGTQQYQNDEIGRTGRDLVTVYRPEEEVFSKETMASFEGMPVTDDHPDTAEGVTIDNIKFLGKGHCQNVRRGTGSDKDLLIADLVIQDEDTIQKVLDGKREISCGYNYELCEENGKFIQRQIRGNHIAIVDRGRAGHRVCIKDSAPALNNERRKTKMPKAKKSHIGILSKMLAALTASDAEPEEIEEAVDAIEEITAGAEETQAVPAEPAEEQTDEAPNGDLAAIMARLDKIEAALAGGAADEEPEEVDPLKKLEDDLDALEKENVGEEEEEPVTPDEDPEEQESHFVDPEEINEQDEEELPEEELPEEDPEAADCKGRDAALRETIKVVRPFIAKLPKAEQRKAADAISKQLRKVSGLSEKATRNDYLRLKNAARKKAVDSKASDANLAQKIMAKRNPHYSK